MFESFALALGAVTTPAPASCSHPPVPIKLVSGPGYGPQGPGTRPYTVVRFQVNAAGAPETVAVALSSGHADDDAAALIAARQWTFVPGAKDCRPVGSPVTYAVGFGFGTHTFPEPCNHVVTMLRGVAPEFPPSAIGVPATTVEAEVQLDAQGRVRRSYIATTSLVPALDRSTLESTWRSVFAPAVASCVPEAMSYRFRANFEPAH